MDTNGKIAGKISIIDIAVIAILLIVIAGMVYRFTASGAMVNRGDAMVDFTVRIEGVRDFTIENYQVGLSVYDRRSNQFIGTVTGFREEPSYQLVALNDGTMIHAALPERINVYVDIEANGRTTYNAIFAEGTFEVTAGSIINMRTRFVEVQGTITSVNVRE